MAVQQRMIRSGRWKFVDHTGYRQQLFDLRDDPDELRDLAQKSGPRIRTAQLLARVREEWDAQAIARRMRTRRQEKDLIAAWVRNTRPENTQLWELRPEQNALEVAR